MQFAVQLFNAIGSDTFGLHGIIENAVESIVQESKIITEPSHYCNFVAHNSFATLSTSSEGGTGQLLHSLLVF